ncbi:hypothetical protein GCM10029964_054860 [Kibdelosporangium lantanae]
MLDAALQAAAAAEVATDQARLPFSWNGVTLHTRGADNLRVRLRLLADDTLSVDVADHTGMPVASVRSLVTRPISTEHLAVGRGGVYDSMFRVDWVSAPLPAPPVSRSYGTGTGTPSPVRTRS